MASIPELLEKQQEIYTRLCELRDSDAPEADGEFRSLASEYDKVKAQADRLQRMEDIEKERQEKEERSARQVANLVHGAPETVRTKRKEAVKEFMELPTSCFRAWALNQLGREVPDELRAKAASCNYDYQRSEFELPLMDVDSPQFRNLNTDPADTGKGAETIPEWFQRSLEIALKAYSGMRQTADIRRTDGFGDFRWPMVDDTVNSAVIRDEGNTWMTPWDNADPQGVDPVFSQLILKAKKYSSQPILITAEMLMDSAFNLAPILGSFCGERIGRRQNVDFTNGDPTSTEDGVNLPAGLFYLLTSNADLSFNSQDIGALAPEDIISLQHAIDPAYMNASNAFMMSNATFEIVRKFRDDSGAGAGTGGWMWQPSFQAGMPDRLAGSPVVLNTDAPAVANGNVPISFGMHSKYKIRDAGPLRVKRLQERYAERDLEAFIGFLRSDGNLLLANTQLAQSRPIVGVKIRAA